jgi:hypothetical protein
MGSIAARVVERLQLTGRTSRQVRALDAALRARR